jgi:outer membrane protein TolC
MKLLADSWNFCGKEPRLRWCARRVGRSQVAQLGLCLGLACVLVFHSLPSQAKLGLEEAVAIAQDNDPWLAGSEFREQSMMARSTAAGTLPDPRLEMGFANLPTDSFDFDQEAMTQFKVGVSQMFPRGDSRALERERLAIMSGQFPYQRDDRRARLAVDVASLWLETYRARESIRLIESDRELFVQLVDVARSSYSSATGGSRQQDLVRAQLELTRLEDRLSVLQERFDSSRSQLGQWLRPRSADVADDENPWLQFGYQPQELSASLPQIKLLQPQLYRPDDVAGAQQLATLFSRHPLILEFDSRISASRTGVELARQKYHPQWSVNASYGYREDDPMGRDRPDFFSVGVGFDLPLFTSNRQDQELQSALADTEVIKTEKALALRKMLASFESQRARLWRIEQRSELYRDRLLPEMQEQAEASLTAYTRDDGDFAEVVRAQIAQLNARIEALDIDIERLRTISALNYFFATSTAGESS